jgi:hypothetical protein
VSARALTTGLHQALRRPAFVVTVIVLGVSAVGLNATVNTMQVYFRKHPVELRMPLASIPGDLGAWRQVTRDQALNPEVQEVLGTDEYIMRQYVDERLVGADAVRAVRDETLSQAQREQILASAFRAHPEAFVSLSITYYTGLVDTVPHVPDRCVVADGYEPTPSDNSYPSWAIAGRNEPLVVRFINFEDQTASHRLNRSIAYVFQVNGRYEASPLGVRRTLQNLFVRNAYYAKVEVMTLLADQRTSARVLRDFLAAALPQIERSLPDWELVLASRDKPAHASESGQ